MLLLLFVFFFFSFLLVLIPLKDDVDTFSLLCVMFLLCPVCRIDPSFEAVEGHLLNFI